MHCRGSQESILSFDVAGEERPQAGHRYERHRAHLDDRDLALCDQLVELGPADARHPASVGHPDGDRVRTSRPAIHRSEEHTSELQSLMRISYAVFCLKKKTQNPNRQTTPLQTDDNTHNI